MRFSYAYARHSASAQIVLILLASFILIFISGMISKMLDWEADFNALMYHFYLPSSLGIALRKPWVLLSHIWVEKPSEIIALIFRMIVLYQLGNLLQTYRNAATVWHLFIVGGIFGAILHLLVSSIVPYYTYQNAYLMGASPALLAVVAGLGTYLPEYKIRLFIFGDVSLKWIAIIWVLVSLVFLPMSSMDHIRHIGGAFYGFLYFRMFKLGIDFMYPWELLKKSVIKKIKPDRRNIVNKFTKSNTDYVSEEELDILLEKVSRSGYASLSTKEKQRLEQASRQK